MNNNKIYKLYGENLRRIRLNNNYTQEQAAQITKLEAKYISQIERGINTGTITTMLKFCRGYNTTPNNLLTNIFKEPKNSKEHDLLVEKFSRLNSRDRKIVMNLIDGMLEN